jgi:hypothetical protein
VSAKPSFWERGKAEQAHISHAMPEVCLHTSGIHTAITHLKKQKNENESCIHRIPRDAYWNGSYNYLLQKRTTGAAA